MRQILVCVGCCMLLLPVSAETDLGIEGTSFTINGKATFLLGVSYYGALGASEEFVRADLDDMQKHGFNWIRVWATWAAFDNDVSAVDAEGRAREPYLKKLNWLIGECDRRGMIVDVTLTRGGRINQLKKLTDAESYGRAVRTLVTALKSQRNWYLDLANERNILDSRFVSYAELAELRKIVREVDPKRLVTASHASDIPDEDVEEYLYLVGVDFLAPHRPRNPKSPQQTAARTRRYLRAMKKMGRVVPVHYQEPFRTGFNTDRFNPTADDFLTDLKQAIRGGAAGWCFHNGDQKNNADGLPARSFDMREKRLFDQLDAVEREFVKRLPEAVADELGVKSQK